MNCFDSLRFVELLLERLRERQAFYAEIILAGGLETSRYITLTEHRLGLQEAEALVKKTYKDLYDAVDIKNQGVTDEFDQFGEET